MPSKNLSQLIFRRSMDTSTAVMMAAAVITLAGWLCEWIWDKVYV